MSSFLFQVIHDVALILDRQAQGCNQQPTTAAIDSQTDIAQGAARCGLDTAKLTAQKKIGAQLAIDDFGTGYSNLRFLKQLPIDILKIYHSFVHEISEPAADGVVASAAIAIGGSFQRHVVAEGIENQTQLDFLKTKNCKEGQGFYFCHPMAGKNIEDFLRKNSPGSDSLLN